MENGFTRERASGVQIVEVYVGGRSTLLPAPSDLRVNGRNLHKANL